MYLCPICGKKSNTENGICDSCRFDRSRNYEAYATISPLKGKNNHAISKKKQNYKSKQRPGAFVCSKCKSIRFHIFPETNKILCVDCGAEIRQEELPWKQPSASSISTSVQKPAFIISPFALQKFPFVSTQNSLYAAALKENGEITYTGKCEKGEFDNFTQWKDIKALVGDWNYTVALKSDGTVAAVGCNNDGECDVLSWRNVAAITTGTTMEDGKGKNFTLALRNDGTVVATKGICYRDEIQQWKDIVSVVASFYIVVGLKADGTVVTVTNLNDKLNVTNWRNIKRISCGNYHAVGLSGNGTIVTAVFDPNENKALCNVYGSEWKEIIAISCGHFHTAGLRADGTVVATGSNVYGQCNTSFWSDIIDISCTIRITFGLKKDGTVIATGNNEDIYGYEDLSSWRDIIAIECRYNHLIGLKADGTVCVSGYDNLSGVHIPDIYRALTTVQQPALTISPFALQKFPFVSAQISPYAVALKENGEITHTGKCEKGEFESFSQWKDIKALAGDCHYTVALKSDGTVSAVGNNEDGQCDVRSWRNIAAITTGFEEIEYERDNTSNVFFTLALRNDGTVVSTKGISWRDEIQQWKDIVSVAVGHKIVVGLKADGTVVVTTSDWIGELDVTNWKNIKRISCGFGHIVGLTGNGTVVTAISDQAKDAVYKALCDVYGSEWKEIVAISCGTLHTVGLREDGTVVVAGINNYNQCNTSSWNDIIDISCTEDITVGLKKDGTIIATGKTECIYGYEDLSSWRDIVAIECRYKHLIGLKADGTVCVSGYDNLSGVRIPDIYKR